MKSGNGLVEISGIEERQKKLAELSTQNPVMQQRIREVIREALKKVQKSLQDSARSGLQMESDPRNAYKAVRMAVYRKIFGGQVNILQNRRAGAMRYYEPPRHPSHRGGNRMRQSDSTRDRMSYTGRDRGFILRFLNDGMTKKNPRVIRFTPNDAREHVHRGSQGGVLSKYGKTINTGNRGAITARNWFGGASQRELEAAAANIDVMIDKIIEGIMY